jgi:uncharacterized protein (DUF1778 family)
MSKLDDQLVVRVHSEQKQAIKAAARAAQTSEGAVIRFLINEAKGLLEPDFFANTYRVRNQDQESDR